MSSKSSLTFGSSFLDQGKTSNPLRKSGDPKKKIIKKPKNKKQVRLQQEYQTWKFSLAEHKTAPSCYLLH
jgi:hypothetical protein